MAPIAGMVPQNIAMWGWQPVVAVAPVCDQLTRGAEPGQRAFLVKNLPAGFLDEAAQHEPVPNAAPRPRKRQAERGDDLGADLLGGRDAITLYPAVGVIGAHGDPEPVRRAHQHGLDFARCVVAQHLYADGLRQQAGCDAIVQRDFRRRLNADRLQLFDMMVESGNVAAGPAGDHQLIDLDDASVEFHTHCQRMASCEFSRSVTSM